MENGKLISLHVSLVNIQPAQLKQHRKQLIKLEDVSIRDDVVMRFSGYVDDPEESYEYGKQQDFYELLKYLELVMVSKAK